MIKKITTGVLLSFGALGFLASPICAQEPLASIEGELTEELSSLLKDVLGDVDTPARSLPQARRRVIKAQKSATSVMRSQGYYGAVIDARVIETAASADAAKRLPSKPVLNITPGVQFNIAGLNIVYSDPNPPAIKDGFEFINLREGDLALAAKVVAAELRITNYLNANGYPDAKANERTAVVDHDKKTMTITYNIYAGQKTIFGDIQQIGTAELAETWPKMVAPFKTGDEFDNRKLNTFASRVNGTGVFKGAVATLSDDATPNNDGSVTRNVLLNVEQGPMNTVSGEVGISTTEGSGAELVYRRRNLLGHAETLTLSSTIKTNEISFGAGYNIPYAWRVDRELDIGMEIAREDTEAFEGERIGGNALVTQKFGKKFKIGLGLGLEASRFEENGLNTAAYLFEGLGRATYDSRNNIFNPEKGYFAEASFVPTYNFGEEDGIFTTATLGGSTYYRLSDSLIAAGRAKIGTIFGGSLSTIPLNRRFYGGGGGSVRGFGFQTISPTNASGELIGGRSISEVGGEIRYKGEGPIGLVGFIDAASVTNSEYPTFDDVRAGGGFGVRYFTSFAPLRADIAFPLNKRESDNSFQLYISIGQAF